MMSSFVHIDCFTSGLDDLTEKQQADERVVLEAVRRMDRVSIFEITCNDTIATTMQNLVESGAIELEKETFPWYRVMKVSE